MNPEAPYLLQRYRLCGVDIWREDGELKYEKESNISEEFLRRTIEREKECLHTELDGLMQAFFLLEACFNLGFSLRTYHAKDGSVADFDMMCSSRVIVGEELVHSLEEMRHYILYILKSKEMAAALDRGERVKN